MEMMWSPLSPTAAAELLLLPPPPQQQEEEEEKEEIFWSPLSPTSAAKLLLITSPSSSPPPPAKKRYLNQVGGGLLPFLEPKPSISAAAEGSMYPELSEDEQEDYDGVYWSPINSPIPSENKLLA